MADTVNAQITDAVTQANVSVLGESPAQSMGMMYQTMTHAMSLLMQNSVASQGGMQQINAAVVASACKQIMARQTLVIQKNEGLPPSPPSPSPSPSPGPDTEPPIDSEKIRETAAAILARAQTASLAAAQASEEAQEIMAGSESELAANFAEASAEAAADAAECFTDATHAMNELDVLLDDQDNLENPSMIYGKLAEMRELAAKAEEDQRKSEQAAKDTEQIVNSNPIDEV